MRGAVNVQRCPHQLSEEEVQESLLAELALPAPMVDTVELEDVRWFHLSWLEYQRRRTGALPSEAAETLNVCLMGCIGITNASRSVLTCSFQLHMVMKDLGAGLSGCTYLYFCPLASELILPLLQSLTEGLRFL